VLSVNIYRFREIPKKRFVDASAISQVSRSYSHGNGRIVSYLGRGASINVSN